MDDTIVAIATPPGRGAIAIIRVSGERAFEIARQHVKPWPSAAGTVRRCEVRDADSNLLDHALVSRFEAPHSFTGEDVVEISSHGGFVVPQSIVSAFIFAGARQAGAGEFSRRAVANGKFDLTQAEAIADLIEAKSRPMQKAALAQLDGALSRRILGLREALIELESLLAYDIDFPEEDDGPISRERIRLQATSILVALHGLIATGTAGEMLREGAVVVIAGAPNVGKSSLFNALAGSDKAIVTDIPGTTRDALEAFVDAGAFPLRLIDTAGLREPGDYVEMLGIEVSRKYLSAADLVIACGEDEEQIETVTSAITELTSAPIIKTRTKVDLVAYSDKPEPTDSGISTLAVSAVTGEGISALLGAIGHRLAAENPVESDSPLLMRSRHLAAVQSAEVELEHFVQSWNADQLPATVAAIHIRAAIGSLEELIGVVNIEQVLDRVFRSFCVGK